MTMTNVHIRAEVYDRYIVLHSLVNSTYILCVDGLSLGDLNAQTQVVLTLRRAFDWKLYNFQANIRY